MYFSLIHEKKAENWRTDVLKKKFLDRFRVLEFISTTGNDRIFLSFRALKKYYISMNLCISIEYKRKQPKIRVSMSSKKVCCVRFGFSNFFRLPETTEFIFLLGSLKSIFSAWTYVFWLITREKSRKLAYRCPQKKIFGSVSGSRIFFDYTKRPNFSFF